MTDTSTYPLSPMQQGMLFHQLLEPGSGADIEQMILRVDEPIDAAAFAIAWEHAARRHEVLRTSFRLDQSAVPLQQVHPRAPMELTEVDQTAYLEEQADARLGEWLARDRVRGFDLSQAPLSRITIFRRRRGRCVVVWTFHHVILDGRSFPIVLADVVRAYDARRAGCEIELPPSVPYRTFIEWLDDYDREAAAEYWRATMAGFATPTPITIAGVGGVEGRTGFAEVRTRMSAASTAALGRVADEVGVTVNTLLQGAWARLLSIYADQTDVVFGATRACRYGTVPEAETIAGLFINTLPMRITIPESATVREWLLGIRAQHVAMRAVEHTPLVEVQAHSAVGPGTRLFDTILVFESYQLDPRLRSEIGTGDRIAYELLEQTNYPLLLSVYGGDELDLRLEFDRSRFDDAMAERALHHVVNLLEAMADDPDAPVLDLHCLGSEERTLLVHTWNPDATDTAPINTAPINTPPINMVDRWRDRVRRSPDAVALIGSDRSLTYADADAESERLAARLHGSGAGPGATVGIILDRSVDAILAMLATLKSGAAYLPLDRSYPSERLQHMLTDSGARVLVTASSLRSSIAPLVEPLPGLAVVELDDDTIDADTIDGARPGPAETITTDTPAYIIYTSGSTGTPKGVVVSHGALVNHADGVTMAYDLVPEDRVLQFAALSFDVAAEEIFPTWMAGGTVVVRTEEVATDFDELHRVVVDHEVTVLNLPAAYWSTWVDHLVADPDIDLPASLRLVITGSEKVSTRDHRRWTDRVGRSVRWLNAYGPTEATITASVHDPAGSDPPPGATMPIGRPIGNVTLHVLDGRGRPTPLGVPGELHIGGRGVAIGYHERPDLTAERFVADPFTERPGARMYRTGDLARWLPDGTVEFLGRIDDQVKVRGFRIELGEIEAMLCSLDSVTDAAVVARPDPTGESRLFAHVVAADPDAAPAVEELRAGLAERLPSYMIPAGYAFLPALPLTPSGKIDRKALPDLAVDERPDEAHVAPRTRLERDLAAAWSVVLGTDEPGVNDNFFASGGNSLTAIRLFSAIQGLTGRRLQLAELFAAPTIAQLAATLGDESPHDAPAALPGWVFPVKSTGSKTPLFHLGGASVLVNLANHLSEDRPLYALLEQDLEADHFHTSVAAIVPHCIEGLRAVQPRGPYLIAGLCFGGVVALEMARRLREEGDEVGFVLMIDSFAPGALTLRTGTTAAGEPTAAGDASRPRRSYTVSRLWRKGTARVWRACWPTLHELSRRSGRPMPSWLRDVEEANTIASDAYEAQPYDGDVTLFIASDKIAQFAIAPRNGWGELVSGTLDVEEVVGGHLSVYAEPHVADLAAKLNARLDRLPY